MSNNPIPRPLKSLLALAEDCADGCAMKQDEVGLKQTREDELRDLLISIKGDNDATPPVIGLIYLYDQAKMMHAAARTAVKTKDAQVRSFLTDARDALKKILGTDWSPEWVMAGYTESGSTAVPDTQDERFASVSTLATYLGQHPTYEVPGGGPYPEITAARANTLHTELSNARQAANTASGAQTNARNARDAAVTTLRKRLIALVDELALVLSNDDPRWEDFGLNIPANPRPPEPASELVLSSAGVGRVLAEWDRGRRSNNDRVLIQVVDVDPDFHEYGKSGGDGEEVIKDQPSGTTLRVKILALNGSLEASSGPVAEIVVD